MCRNSRLPFLLFSSKEILYLSVHPLQKCLGMMRRRTAAELSSTRSWTGWPAGWEPALRQRSLLHWSAAPASTSPLPTQMTMPKRPRIALLLCSPNNRLSPPISFQSLPSLTPNVTCLRTYMRNSYSGKLICSRIELQ
ncbi:hypothetical protein CDL12_09990 [Handroanthus impetiginosus]|uniref:Uncharacterized protein n=1 Tax=Handroanthus impetiginosus TaxID=429701 RepID=A0A2G9HIL5_9LAMI|nr:hypothetical protein CDL12_09990 [Handroanthus impetiginosus]